MQNSKHCLKKQRSTGEKKRIIISRRDFPLCAPRGLSVEEKQHVQEVRWDVRKAFSGSIQAGEREREGKGASQPARLTDTERGTQSPGEERRVFREQPVLFRSTVTLLSQSWLERPTQHLPQPPRQHEEGGT